MSGKSAEAPAADARIDSIIHLHRALSWLSQNPYPHVAGPETLKKRASVALIVRVQPSHAHKPDINTASARDIDSFFAQEWVKFGQAEVLFIKRAARKGDRWTSHVALPGGKRDPDDDSDEYAAVREAVEEVGIDLSGDTSITVGNLPQRVVTTSWGRVPLMVLCPYVFLITSHHLPPLHLQPTEVASTHWVPIHSLLDPRQRTVSLEHVSNRLDNQETGIKRWALAGMLGKMEFSAIQLLPSESIYCHETPAAAAAADHNPAPPRNIIKRLLTLTHSPTHPPPPQHQPLILWGLTLGVMADFLDLLPPHNALELWTYPTFTMPDVRLVVWLTTYRFREGKRLQLESDNHTNIATTTGKDDTNEVLLPKDERGKDVGMGGLGSGCSLNGRSFESVVGSMLEGYYTRLRKGVTYALICRAVGILAFTAWLWSKRRTMGKRLF
jgi:8-oxo-dGTP pyrophosphatase MutT (NUDIX family)